jgi:hypothetical protein
MSIPKSVTTLVEKSGNNFHAKVARWLNANEWHTIVSPYYMDQTQGKARELDIVAEKFWPIRNRWDDPIGDVVVRILVECKFIASESVFWFAPKNMTATRVLVHGLGPFKEDNAYTKKHHYLADSASVAKLFTSSNGKAQEADPFYKALNQALNGTIALRHQPTRHPELQRRAGVRLVTLNYPVVVCSSFAQLYATDFLVDSEPTLLKENFQMEVEYAYHDKEGRQRNDHFLLDFVEFDKLSDFQKSISIDAESAAYMASFDERAD